jgi:regulator of sigma E protease
MSTFWIRFLQLLLSLTILVVIHELGHFLFSRLFKTRVEKFYLFFNPRISLIRIKKVDGKVRVRFFAPNVPESYTEEKRYNFEGNEEIIYTPIDLDSLPEGDWRRSPENTEFGVGWIPFGGYCKIAGMIDESMGVPHQTLLAASAHYGGRCALQPYTGILHIFDGAFQVGRQLYPCTRP